MRLFGGATKPRARHAGLSDVGRRREKNEDAVAVLVAQPGWGFELAAIVCDGVGGQPRGEMASVLAIEAFRRALERVDERPIAERLRAAGEAASAAITDYARREVEGAKLATTAVAVVLHDGRATVAHVGDSRAYLYRRGELRPLTQDHSFVAEQVRAGLMLASEAKDNPFRSRLSRALGTDLPGSLDVSDLATEPGDVFLLCSDGLHAFVEEPEIAKALSDDLAKSARRLVALANAAGGIDNITVALCRAE